jgi:hypothetical protein
VADIDGDGEVSAGGDELVAAASVFKVAVALEVILTISDNAAIDVLIDRVGLDSVHATLAALGLRHTVIPARLQLIWRDEAGPAAACAPVRQIMGRQVTRQRLALGFPRSGTQIPPKAAASSASSATRSASSQCPAAGATLPPSSPEPTGHTTTSTRSTAQPFVGALSMVGRLYIRLDLPLRARQRSAISPESVVYACGGG